MDLSVTFTSLNQANVDIFQKHWEIFSINYNKDIRARVEEQSNKTSSFPHLAPIGTDSVAWLFKMPLNRIFKLKQ